MNLTEYPEWESAVLEIAEAGGTAMVIGGTDAGKTTFATLLANACASLGKLAAFMDADLGQSEIGPPACVGLALLPGTVARLDSIKATAFEFVGNTGPRGRMLEHVVAVRRIVDIAASSGPHLIILDTTGYIQGHSAQRLKQAKAKMVRPSHIVALQRQDECEALLAGMARDQGVELHRLPIPSVISRKSPSFRKQRRAARFGRYFQDSERRTIDFRQASFTHTWLNTGTPVAPNILRFLSESTGTMVPYAEQIGRFIGIVTAGVPTRTLSLVHEHFHAHTIAVTPQSRYGGLLLGLSTRSGLLGLALLSRIDFNARTLEVISPVRSIANITQVHFGIISLDVEGREISAIKPGDV